MPSNTYYIIQRTVESRNDYLNSIMRNTLGFTADYAQATRFDTADIANSFLDFCEANSQDVFTGMEVTLTIQPISGE